MYLTKTNPTKELSKIWQNSADVCISSLKIFENIFLIGLAFKDNTDDLRHSPTISIYKILDSKSQSVHIFDLDNFEYSESEIKQNFLEKSLIVEMYPIGSSLKSKVEEELKVINEFTYLKFWE